MHDLSLEGLEPRYLRPCLVIQIPSSRDQNIRIIMDSLSRLEILNIKFPIRQSVYWLNGNCGAAILIPFLLSIVPHAARNFVRELHISHHPVFLRDAFQVLPDLLGRCVEIGPVRVRVEGVLVAMSWDVARTAFTNKC